MFRKLIFNLIAISGFYCLQAQDQIVKTNGDEIFGKVIRVNTLDVIFKKKDNIDGPEYSELKANILFIKYENGQKDIFTTANTPVSGQVSSICEPVKRKNSVFFEAGGNGMYASLNYERRFFNKRNNNFLAVKVGVGPFATINILNMTATYNIGDGMNFFEIGGGGGLFTSEIFNSETTNNDYYFPFVSPTIGYRRQSAKGFLFRAFLTSLTIRREDNVRDNDYYYNNQYYYYQYKKVINYNYYPFLGISVGYSF